MQHSVDLRIMVPEGIKSSGYRELLDTARNLEEANHQGVERPNSSASLSSDIAALAEMGMPFSR